MSKASDLPTNARSRSRNAVLREWPSSSRANVVTLLDPELRSIIDRATDGAFVTTHLDRVEDAAHAVRTSGAHALLLSPRVAVLAAPGQLRRLIAKSPGVVPIAVLGQDWPAAQSAVLWLGGSGVREIVNLAEREGWNKLRAIVDRSSDDRGTSILRQVLDALADASDESRHFFATLVRLAPTTSTTRQLARICGVTPSTLMSRFFRAKLPGPRTYLAMTRLLYATAYFEIRGASLADVADRLAYSSPQSFCRHVRGVLGVTAGELRQRMSRSAMMEHYIARMIQPYLQTFATFDPIGPGPIPSRSHYRDRVLPVGMAAEPC